ncbi:MAG: sugar ABC transporter permease [Caldilineaceae bacterium]|nr:sugar ABC transporter permease [Caldilineaceae bacterium]
MTAAATRSQAEQRKQRKRFWKAMAFCSPWLIGFLCFGVIPIIASFYFSFTTYSVLQPPRWIGLDNYISMLTSDRLFWLALGNTLYYTVLSNLIGIVLALSLAMLLNMNVHGMTVYRTIYYIPVIIPIVASSIVWLWLFNPQYGVLNLLVRNLGIAPIPWLTDPGWSKPSLVLMSLWSVGNAVVIFLAGLQDVPKELLEAAELDGANEFQRIRSVMIPIITPVILFNLVIGLIGGFQVFSQAYIMTNGGPADSTLFYSLYLYQNAFRFFKMGYAAGMAWVLFLIILVATLLVFRSSSRWVHYSGE